MFETDVNLSVNKIKKNRGSDNAQRRKHPVNQPEARPTSYHQARSKTNQCPRCGYEHPPRSCPAYGKTCGACGKQNHFKSQMQRKTFKGHNKALTKNKDELMKFLTWTVGYCFVDLVDCLIMCTGPLPHSIFLQQVSQWFGYFREVWDEFPNVAHHS
ncbi:actin-binding lim protein 1-like protein [Plakobranchus ocellatus]|uniref:Actin-binding lim protein 1-like protein n=1 Tax=Plakobranchus ocellatus TaxID=259542 RepID=A0AAV4CVH0_9GAST|nr:actin-binding lim protein 1-like protein [Plakobranchus ocellatus]